MAFTSASKTRLAYIPETAWGETPATPAYKNLRFTGESLNAEKGTVTSNEIRQDRNVSDVIQVSRTASGNIDAEMSYATFDEIFESALGSAWAANVLKNGTTQRSVTLEKTFEKADGSEIFHRFAGCVVNTMNIDVTAQQLITVGFGIMGRGVTAASAPITGATYANANSNDVLSAAVDFASLQIGGLSGGESPAVQALTIATTNNLRQQAVVGALDLAGLGDGRFEMTGTLNVYFEDEGIYEAFLNHDALSLEFLLGEATGQRYRVRIPKLKITSGTTTATGNDADVMANLNWQALYDSTIGATIEITRAV